MALEPAPRPELPQTVEEAYRLILMTWEENRTLREENQALRQTVAALEERLRTNSSNSSKPPTSDPPWKKVRPPKEKKGKRSRGGQPGHPGSQHKLAPAEQVDERISCPPEEQCSCGGRVVTDPQATQVRQVYEIPEVRPHITEYEILAGTCDRCGRAHVGAAPRETPEGMLGPRAMALVAFLSGRYHLSKRDIADFFGEHLGIPLCPATVCATEGRVSGALADAVQEVRDALPQQPVVHLDETGHRVAGQRFWVWVILSTRLVAFAVRKSRGADVAKELLGPDFSGRAVTDRWSAYTFVDPQHRQLCWAHLFRDFVRIAERGGASAAIGTELGEQAGRLFHAWHQVGEGGWTHAEFQVQVAPIRREILDILRRGTHVDHPKTQRTCANLLNLQVALFTFVDHEGVPPTKDCYAYCTSVPETRSAA